MVGVAVGTVVSGGMHAVRRNSSVQNRVSVVCIMGSP
jgi:F0F1-type ATP synthase membrane subunit c/vacuolar-type H+-ATPase subunit K